MKFARLAIHSGGASFIMNFKNEKLLEEKYKLRFNDRLLLEELGFLTANDLQFKISKTENKKGQSVFISGNICIVHEKLENKPEQQLQVLVFTKIGQELLNMVKSTPDLDYIQLIASKLNRNNGPVRYAGILEMLENGQIQHTGLVDVPLTDKEEEHERKRKEAEEKQRNANRVDGR